MKKIDRERVSIFRNVLEGMEDKEITDIFFNMKDEQVLKILNAAILPNSVSRSALKFNVFVTMLRASSKKERDAIWEGAIKAKNLAFAFSKKEKEIFLFGLFNKITRSGWESVYARFVKSDIYGNQLAEGKRKKISSYFFERAFPFIQSILKKGESGGQFPRI